jgi:hypothetical protein
VPRARTAQPKRPAADRLPVCIQRIDRVDEVRHDRHGTKGAEDLSLLLRRVDVVEDLRHGCREDDVVALLLHDSTICALAVHHPHTLLSAPATRHAHNTCNVRRWMHKGNIMYVYTNQVLLV